MKYPIQMKYPIFLLLFMLIGVHASLSAQNVAIVDVSAILEDMEDYQAAQTELDRVAAEWNQEIAQAYDDIKSMYNKYQAEQVLLSDEMRKEREDEIMKQEKQVRELQHEKFGPEGELFDRRMQLVNPIQERVYAAMEAYAEERGVDIIFDKSGAAGLLFVNEKYDKTSSIRRKLNIK